MIKVFKSVLVLKPFSIGLRFDGFGFLGRGVGLRFDDFCFKQGCKLTLKDLGVVLQNST